MHALAILLIGKDILTNLEHKNLINSFISQKIRRIRFN